MLTLNEQEGATKEKKTKQQIDNERYAFLITFPSHNLLGCMAISFANNLSFMRVIQFL
jgi:hypothetical protein